MLSWALYTEKLSEEMGFSQIESKFGRLSLRFGEHVG